MLTPASAIELDAATGEAMSLCVPRYLHTIFFSTFLGINRGERHMRNNRSVLYSLSSENLISVHTPQRLTSKATIDCDQLPSRIPATLPNAIPEIIDGKNVSMPQYYSVYVYGIHNHLYKWKKSRAG